MPMMQAGTQFTDLSVRPFEKFDRSLQQTSAMLVREITSTGLSRVDRRLQLIKRLRSPMDPIMAERQRVCFRVDMKRLATERSAFSRQGESGYRFSRFTASSISSSAFSLRAHSAR